MYTAVGPSHDVDSKDDVATRRIKTSRQRQEISPTHYAFMQDSTGTLFRGRGRQMRPSDKPPVVNSVWPLTRLLLFLSVRLSLVVVPAKRHAQRRTTALNPVTPQSRVRSFETRRTRRQVNEGPCVKRHHQGVNFLVLRLSACSLHAV